MRVILSYYCSHKACRPFPLRLALPLITAFSLLRKCNGLRISRSGRLLADFSTATTRLGHASWLIALVWVQLRCRLHKKILDSSYHDLSICGSHELGIRYTLLSHESPTIRASAGADASAIAAPERTSVLVVAPSTQAHR